MKKNTYLGLAFTSSPLPFLNDALVAPQEITVKKESKTKQIHDNQDQTHTVELILLSVAAAMFLYWLAQGLEGLLQ